MVDRRRSRASGFGSGRRVTFGPGRRALRPGSGRAARQPILSAAWPIGGPTHAAVTESHTMPFDTFAFTTFHAPAPAGTDRRRHTRELAYRPCAITPPPELGSSDEAFLVDRSVGGALIEWAGSPGLRIGDTVGVLDGEDRWVGHVVRVCPSRPRPAFALARVTRVAIERPFH